MKYYIAYYVLGTSRESIRVHRKFKTRVDAINYAIRYLPKNVELITEIKREKHFIEYIFSNSNRLFVKRCLVA